MAANLHASVSTRCLPPIQWISSATCKVAHGTWMPPEWHIFCATCHLACTWRATHICTTTSTARAGCHWGHRALARGDRWLIGHRFIIQTSYKCHRREKYVFVCINEMKLSLPSLSKYIYLLISMHIINHIFKYPNI